MNFDCSFSGPEDIYNGEVKLILGFIWTVIRHFQIRSTGRALSTKNAMLAWINTQIPDQNITNFTTDWNDGVALCALVDRIQPGLCPHYATLDRSNQESNCQLGIKLAEEQLEIPRLLEPGDLCSGNVDEISVMTYLSYFCKPANERLMNWIQSRLPDQGITNFKTDWNNGINLACLVNSLDPGIFPNCHELDPHETLENLLQAMQLAEDNLSVKPVITASQMADPNVDELNVTTYLSRFQYAKPVPQPQEVTCNGTGLYKAFVGKPAQFEVDTSRAGVGDLKVSIVAAGGSPIAAEVTQSDGGTFEVSYVPQIQGKLTIDVKWNGSAVPSSPFTVEIIDPSMFSFTGKQINGGQCAKVGKLVVMEAKGLNDVSDLLMLIQHPDGHNGSAKIVPNGNGQAECSYTPLCVGKDKIFVKVAGADLPGSPFEVKVVDPSQCSVTPRDLPPGKSIMVNEETTLVLTASQQNLLGIIAEVETPSSVQNLDIVPQKDDVNLTSFTPSEIGNYSIMVTCAGENIRGSPLSLTACDASKCTLLDTLPHYVQIGHPVVMNLSTEGAGPGEASVDASKCKAFGTAIESPTSIVVGKPLKFKVDCTNVGTGQLKVTASDSSSKTLPVFLANEECIHTIKIDPQVQGKHQVTVLWCDKHVPGSPFTFEVSNPKNIVLLDLPDSSSFIGRIGEPILIRADMHKAGTGAILAAAKLESGKIEDFELEILTDGIVQMKYIPKEAGKLELILTCSGVNLLPLPWICDIVNPTLFQVTPPKGYGKQKAYVRFVISGLTKKNVKNIAITAIHKEHNAKVKVEYGKKGTAIARFTAKKIGEYKVEVMCANKHVDHSPFTVLIANPDSCKITGDIPTVIPLRYKKEFQVDTKCAGPGELTFSCQTQSGNTSENLDCQFQVKQTSSTTQQVTLKGVDCGMCEFSLKWAGYNIPNMPHSVVVVDPASCSFYCPQVKIGAVKQGEKFAVVVDTSKGGSCTPQVAAAGPKAHYQVELKDTKNGKYTATFTPWQDGKHTLEVCVGGANVEGSPMTFDVIKPVDASKITVSGPGLNQAVANRHTEVTIFAQKSQLLERGTLSYNFKLLGAVEEEEIPDVECKDNGNGTYNLVYTPKTTGGLELTILCEGKPIKGCPFNIDVKPEPDAKKCTISGDALGADIFHQINDPVELTVDTTTAGTGSLTISGTKPDEDVLRVFTTEEQETNKHVHFLKFDPTLVGTYNLSVMWEGDHIQGSPFVIRVVDPSKCVIEGSPPSCLQLGQSKVFVINTEGAGNGEVVISPTSEAVETEVRDKGPNSYEVVITGAELGEAMVEVKYGGHSVPRTPFEVCVCDPEKCVMNMNNIQSQTQQVGVPLHFSITTHNAGKAKLHVKPQDLYHQYTIDVKEGEDEIWEVSCTPWSIGEQKLQVLWGEFVIPGSPVAFTVSDPKQCVISGLPDPQNFLAIMGEPILFTVDYSKTGGGTLTTLARLPDGSTEELEREDRDEVAAVSYTPRVPGKLELLLQFNGVDILPSPWLSNVPEPSRFRVTPPKGHGKQKKSVKFAIMGITEDMQDLSIEAVHPEHNVTVETEPGNNAGTVIARFTAKEIGEYTIKVKFAGQHIDGSPFQAQVANPDSCTITSALPKAVHIGVPATVCVDTNEAGPGELSCQSEVLSGDIQVKPEVSADQEEDSKHNIVFTSESVGRCRLTAKWANYTIPSTPFEVSFVDSSKVLWSCAVLEKGHVKQGEVMEVVVDCKEGGIGTPEVKAWGTKVNYTTETQDNQDGTFTVCITPWQVGENSLEILWGGKPIQDMPVQFEVVKDIDVRSITASGEGLRHAIADQQTEIVLSAPEPGLVERGMLTVSSMSEKAAEEGDRNAPIFVLKDNRDETYTLTFLANTKSRYQLHINFEGRSIIGSPFAVAVSAAPDASMCKAFGGAIEPKQGLMVNNPVQFSIDSTDAGSGRITVSATQPSRKPIQVYMLDEEKRRRLHHLKFDPDTVGHYAVEVHWEGEPIPGSPFDFAIIDPSKCKVSGLPLPSIITHIEELINFNVHFQEAGEGIPQVSVAVPGKSELLVLQHTPMSESIFSYEFKPTVFGSTSISIEFGGYNVPGSPYKFQVVDPSKFGITGLSIKGNYALVCELVSFGIAGKTPGEEKLVAIAHGPSADINVDVSEKGDVASFVPIEPGAYEVFVKCAGSHVSGSPFTVQVADPSKCQVLGDVPSVVQVGSSEEFVVKTQGAGAGNLEVLLNGLKEHPSLECKVQNQGLNTYAITLTGRKTEEVDIEVQWAGYSIPQCPFKVSVCDASQCKAFGQVLMAKKGRAGEAIMFTVVTFHAGKAKLVVKPKGPSAQYNVEIQETKESTYKVTFTPWEIGGHKVDVLWGNTHIPKSPFDISIENTMDSNVCNATGEGLKHAIASQPATFTIISSKVGLLDKNALKVFVIGVQSPADVVVKDNNNGCYTVEYVAPTAGAYIVSVSFYDQQIPGSPFKVNVVPGADATKCRAFGPAFHPNSFHIAASPLEFYVDTSEGGYGQLRVYVQGPHNYRPKIFLADDGKGVHSVKFDAMRAGRYFVVVVWSENHIPGSPFKIHVHPAADASKVKAYGPGLKDGFLGDTGKRCACVCV